MRIEFDAMGVFKIIRALRVIVLIIIGKSCVARPGIVEIIGIGNRDRIAKAIAAVVSGVVPVLAYSLTDQRSESVILQRGCKLIIKLGETELVKTKNRSRR